MTLTSDVEAEKKHLPLSSLYEQNIHSNWKTAYWPPNRSYWTFLTDIMSEYRRNAWNSTSGRSSSVWNFWAVGTFRRVRKHEHMSSKILQGNICISISRMKRLGCKSARTESMGIEACGGAMLPSRFDRPSAKSRVNVYTLVAWFIYLFICISFLSS